MTAKKSPSTTASKSAELTDAPETQVSTSNLQIIMQPDNSTTPNPAVNSDNAVNSTTTANAVADENLFGNDQTSTEATSVIETTKLRLLWLTHGPRQSERQRPVSTES